jgi:transposase-like protein
MRTRSTAAKMARLVARWRASAETQAGFARRHGIPPWTFWYWCRKLTASASAPMFVPVRVTEADAAPVLEIVLTSGDRVQVRAGASAELLAGTVRALRPPC